MNFEWNILKNFLGELFHMRITSGGQNEGKGTTCYFHNHTVFLYTAIILGANPYDTEIIYNECFYKPHGSK